MQACCRYVLLVRAAWDARAPCSASTASSRAPCEARLAAATCLAPVLSLKSNYHHLTDWIMTGSLVSIKSNLSALCEKNDGQVPATAHLIYFTLYGFTVYFKAVTRPACGSTETRACIRMNSSNLFRAWRVWGFGLVKGQTLSNSVSTPTQYGNRNRVVSRP